MPVLRAPPIFKILNKASTLAAQQIEAKYTKYSRGSIVTHTLKKDSKTGKPQWFSKKKKEK